MKNILLSKKNLLYNLITTKTKTQAKICAVVKANAYGHGVKEICEILKNKVEFFAVANLIEGLEIRSFDKKSKILIMGKCDDYVTASENNLSVTIFNKTELKKLKNCLKKIKQINIHIKINSGMNRIGFSKIEDFAFALNELKNNKKVNIKGIFTHFATLRNDIDYFRTQQKIFDDFLKIVPNNIKPIIHGGGSLTCLFSNNYDMIRCGIFLYGYGFKKLKPVMSAYADIIHTEHISKNTQVGYSKSFIANKDMKIGVIAVGYDDGIPRNFIGQNMYYKKQPIKILSVCMDMTILEINENITISNKITIFNNATTWAKILNTNDHDILVKFTNFRGDRKIK